MNRPKRLNKGDRVAIVSLSRGVIGEDFAKHQLPLGEANLRKFGLEPVYMDNSLKGMQYIQDNPKKRVDDLKQAFSDDSIKGIICAIGGDDTFKIIPFIMEDQELQKLIKDSSKLFLGFSDSTINHLTFYKLGLATLYGQAFLTDLAELSGKMLPYSEKWFRELINPSSSALIESSTIWHKNRTSFGPDQVGVEAGSQSEKHGHETLHGSGVVQGRLLGGCIESLAEALAGNRYPDEPKIIAKYSIFPDIETWSDKIIFLETSEEKPSPEKLESMLKVLDEAHVFEKAKAVLIGKPQDEAFYDEYKLIWQNIAKKYNLPMLYNLNFGHGSPRAILPYNGLTKVDFDNKSVLLKEPLVV